MKKLSPLTSALCGAGAFGSVMLLMSMQSIGGQTPISVLNPQQQAILSHMSLVMLDDGQGGMVETLRISGVNLQVVNGLGSSTTSNGTGNVIVGYNEFGNPFGDSRVGSHYLVVGSQNTYTTFGGAVMGVGNSATGQQSSVLGGEFNRSTGFRSAVVGGDSNTASGAVSAVLGGGSNTASNTFATVQGGSGNVASGAASAITGGLSNQATNSNTAVLGGETNIASGLRSIVAGGHDNQAIDRYCGVFGGNTNVAGPGWTAAIMGGSRNTASSDAAAILGGDLNIASGNTSTVSGGQGHNSTGILDWRAGGLFQDF